MAMQKQRFRPRSTNIHLRFPCAFTIRSKRHPRRKKVALPEDNSVLTTVNKGLACDNEKQKTQLMKPNESLYRAPRASSILRLYSCNMYMV